MSRSRWDESDVPVRASRRGSRPRTKRRPEHADARTGMVVAVDRGRYAVELDDGTLLNAMRARELGRTQIVVGDQAYVVGDLTGAQGSLARIVRIGERRTQLRRSADDDSTIERIVVANADLLVVVVALADPEPRPRMIDRCLVAALDAGMDAIVCATKADLADPTPLRELYRPLGIDVIALGMQADGVGPLEPLRAALAGRVSVLLGHSGVGKSTLVNALIPSAERATGAVNATTGRGRHTSTSAVGLRLPAVGSLAGGWLIDTPGVRSLGLAHAETAHIIAAFRDLAAVIESCPRGCTHLADSPDCELDEWVADAAHEDEAAGRRARVDSLRRILTARGEAKGEGRAAPSGAGR